ncbi:myotonic dystrophy kinase like protein [Ecytonucleospora hepatopenaei]|nr:myotonic dystrophy kinase like protein [Ecytonucleospora hepatopenaei]
MYGMVNQTYHCLDCLITVHRECYVLVEVSCELQQAINKGTYVPVVMNSIEEKERILKVYRR